MEGGAAARAAAWVPRHIGPPPAPPGPAATPPPPPPPAGALVTPVADSSKGPHAGHSANWGTPAEGDGACSRAARVLRARWGRQEGGGGEGGLVGCEGA